MLEAGCAMMVPCIDPLNGLFFFNRLRVHDSCLSEGQPCAAGICFQACFFFFLHGTAAVIAAEDVLRMYVSELLFPSVSYSLFQNVRRSSPGYRRR